MTSMKSKPLWGVSDSGTLYTPAGRALISLPRFLAFRIHRWLNS